MSNLALATQLKQMPGDLAGPLGELVLQEGFKGAISAVDALALAERSRTPLSRLPMLLTPLAQAYALTPTSGFHVGAVALGVSGALYFGANLEIPGQALGFSCHAEQAMVANAWIHGEQGLSAIAVTAAPCGHCRQFLFETTTGASLTVELLDLSPTPLPSLLPRAFGPRDLGIEDALLAPRHNGLALEVDQPDPLLATALAAANAAYSPYTQSPAGVALRCADGTVVVGRYAESAAYNPSLPPVICALSQLVLGGHGFDQIVEAAMVQAPGRATQVDVTRTVLGAVTDARLAVAYATPVRP